MDFRKHLLFLLLAAQSTLVSAVQVDPADFVFLNGTTSFDSPDLASTVQNDNLLSFSGIVPVASDFGGDVQNRVTLSDTLETLIFAPRIRDTYINIASPTVSASVTITGFQLDGYSGFDTDIDYRTDGSGDVGPGYVLRSFDGDTLSFFYADGLQIDGTTQEESLFPSILTDATEFDYSGTMVLTGFYNGDTTDTFSIVVDGVAVPVASVPIPTSIMLLGSALFGLLTIGNKKQ